MNTTLAQIREFNPCTSGWKKLLYHLGPYYPEDHPIPLTTILESNGWKDAVWALRTVNGSEREICLFVYECAELVLPRFEKRFPNDKRPRQAIEVARRYVKGLATAEELKVVTTYIYARVNAIAYVTSTAYIDDADIESLFRKHFTT